MKEQPTAIEAEAAVRLLIEYAGEDPDREGLNETPQRFVRAFDYLVSGYGQDPGDVLATTFDADGYDEMVVLRDIEFYSTCEHHLMPFTGLAHVAYVPSRRVVGLSKLARLVDCFARRLQIQERMTAQIAQAIKTYLKPRGVGVAIDAKHFCMACRGVQKQSSQMVTSSLLGCFRKPAARAEFFAMLRGPA